MLTSQLCGFDNKTDSKPNWVKKSSYYGCVVRIVYFVKILIDALCHKLIPVHASWWYYALTQETTTIKAFT